jgi:hypothetical protein
LESAFIISSNAKGVFPFFRHLSTTLQAMQEPCSMSGKEFSHRFERRYQALSAAMHGPAMMSARAAEVQPVFNIFLKCPLHGHLPQG